MAITNIRKTGGTSVIPILSADIDNVVFNNIPAGSKGTKGSTFWNDKANTNVWKDGGDGTQWKPAVNAVDINWNGAQLKNGSTVKATLNTTGEMLSILQTAYNYATTYNVKYSGGKLYDDKDTEIKVGSDYTLPTATENVLGGVKVGTGLSISDGKLSVNSEYITENELTAKSYITTSAADGKYAYKVHTHSDYAPIVHSHSNYAPKSHASTATTYGVGTDANYGHLKISDAYTTQTSAADTALSLGAAYNLYTAFVTRINELTSEIESLKSTVDTLKGFHTIKPVTAVTVTPTTYTLYGKGNTTQLKYSILPTDASNKTVTWNSSATGIATVNDEGIVTSKAIGPVTITATANDGSGKNGTCAVTVSEARITRMIINTNYIEAEYGSIIYSGFDPRYDIMEGDGNVFNHSFTYTVTRGESATIDSQTGKISIENVGETYFKISSNADSAYFAVVSVNITKGNQTLSANQTTLSWGTSEALTAKEVTISGNKTGPLIVSSSNPNITTNISGSTTVTKVTITPTSRGINNAKVTISAPETDYYNSSSVVVTVDVPEAVQYYWYAGWTEPTAENIGDIIKEKYPASKASTTMNPAGKSATSTEGVVMDYNAANIYNRSADLQYYVVVPNGQGIYDSLGTRLDLDDATFTIHSSTTIANHTIYRSSDSARVIVIIIKKIV